MSPDYSASLEFLRRWCPDGPWVLTSILVERKGIETATFEGGQEDQLLAWLERVGQECNVYFHVNPTRGPLTKKATREDVRELAWLHVDIDPRAGEDIEEEREPGPPPPEGAARGHPARDGDRLLRRRLPGLLASRRAPAHQR